MSLEITSENAISSCVALQILHDSWSVLVVLSTGLYARLRQARHFKSAEGPGDKITAVTNNTRPIHLGQTSDAFFASFSGILLNIKWKHGQGCIK